MKRLPVSNEQFVQTLAEYFDACKTKSTVFITMKRYCYEDDQKLRIARKALRDPQNSGPQNPDSQNNIVGTSMSAHTQSGYSSATKEYPCLVRAQAGKHSVTTLVSSSLLLSTHVLPDLTVQVQVQPDDTDRFLDKYGTLLKSKLDSLRSSEKSIFKSKYENGPKVKKSVKSTLKPTTSILSTQSAKRFVL